MSNPKKIHYVDNKKFYDAIVEYHRQKKEAIKKGLDAPRIPEYVGECILKIATKLSTMPRFYNYSFREEMISDGIENCLLYFDDFDPEYVGDDDSKPNKNPFAYFTTIVYYAFVRKINEEEKGRYKLYKNFQEDMILNTVGTNLLIDQDGSAMVSTQMYDNINDFIERFEQKEERKKAKRKKAKEEKDKAKFDWVDKE